MLVPPCAYLKTLSDSSSTKELLTIKGTFGRAFSDLPEEAFPLVQTKRDDLLSKPPVPSALSPHITKTLKATFSELSKLIYAPF